LQRSLPGTKLLSAERGDWLNNHLFDKFAERLVTQCDVFHFVSSIGLYCARKAKLLGATIICDVRQEHPSFQRLILEEEARRYGVVTQVTGSTYEQKVLDEFKLADFIVVPSTHAKRTYVAQGFVPERILILPYGVDLTDFHPSTNRPSTFRVVYAGSLTLRKGVQYLLELFAGSRIPGAELILAGPVDPLFKPILSRFKDSYTYLGVIPKLDLRALYASCSVFVLPSLADSFSLATLEAMACGLPVIITENTGAADAIDDGRNGFVIPIQDVTALQDRLGCLRNNSFAALEMGARAAETARAMSWSRYGAKGVEMYKQIQTFCKPSAPNSKVTPTSSHYA
jgi:glycosyltransferase involved in cell wall biosynthesis